MTIKRVIARQYQNIIQQAFEKAAALAVPPEGWICTMRKALGMSGVQLARRLGLTKAWIYRTEKAELSGNVTLKTMQSMAEAMGCRFVYAIVPEQNINELVLSQARKKAAQIVKTTNTQMALEAQTLTAEQIDYEIDRLAKEMIEKMPPDFWDNE